MAARSPLDLPALRPAMRDHFSWDAWARCVEARGVTIDRPARTAHPEDPSVIYPLDYGFIPGTTGPDGEPVDVFVGSGPLGLVGALLTTSPRQGDRDVKLLLDCPPPEIYMAHGFINYDRTLLEGVLVLRRPMPALWEHLASE
jgi:inorganic pyrophosphatase